MLFLAKSARFHSDFLSIMIFIIVIIAGCIVRIRIWAQSCQWLGVIIYKLSDSDCDSDADSIWLADTCLAGAWPGSA